ncbi:hypothetical protein [Flavobacterium sp. 9AF]
MGIIIVFVPYRNTVSKNKIFSNFFSINYTCKWMITNYTTSNSGT